MASSGMFEAFFDNSKQETSLMKYYDLGKIALKILSQACQDENNASLFSERINRTNTYSHFYYPHENGFTVTDTLINLVHSTNLFSPEAFSKITTPMC